MKHCTIIGINSDIAKGVRARLERDDWTVSGTDRHSTVGPADRWDLCIIAQGTTEPIGPFFETPQYQWEASIVTNALAPLGLLRTIWPHRKYGAKVVFMSGPNSALNTPSYTAYRAGKSILQTLVGTLNEEVGSKTFVYFVPGIVNTKIHQQALAAGERAGNYHKVLQIVEGAYPAHSMDDVYLRLMALAGFMPFPETEGL